MEELERLKRKIKNAKDLQSVVKIMKTISASNIREYELAVESLTEYNKTIEMGFQIILQNKNEPFAARSVEEKKGLGAVIFGSDQGLCGSFNEQIAGYAIYKMNKIEHEKRRALAVGERVIARLEEAGQPIEAHFSFSENHLGITQVMLDVLVKIEEWRLERDINQIVLFYNKPISEAASSEPHMVYLFPLDINWLNSLSEKKWPSRNLPTFSMDVDQLFSSLLRQYLFLSLYRAFVESLASENTSRLMSMQAAEKNIQEHLNDLNAQFHRQRQTAITSELLDIVTGFDALTSR